MRKIALAITLIVFMVGFAAVASAEYGGSCVRYVKNQRIGGYNWDKAYKLQSNKKKAASWIGANEIWNKLVTSSRGSDPKKNSALVIDSFTGSSVGHVAVVTKVSGNKIYVRHSNWDAPNTVSTGYYTRVSAHRVTYNGGKKQYPLMGFVYKP